MNVWKVLVADGDAEVHAAASLALKGLEFRGREILLFNARTLSDARSAVSVHPDIACVLLDFALEETASPPGFLPWLRGERGNADMQVLVRSERQLRPAEISKALQYGINDWRRKSELTVSLIPVIVTAALRAWDSLSGLREQHEELRRMVDASARAFRYAGLPEFERDSLSSLSLVLHGSEGEAGAFALFASRAPHELVPRVTTATGRFRHLEGRKLKDVLEPGMYERILNHNYARGHLSLGKLRVYGFKVRDGSEAFIVLEDADGLSEWTEDLLESFRLHLGVAVENFHLHRGVESARDDLVFALGEMAESRSEETWNHVKRVAEIARIIGQGLGMGEYEAEQLRLAASLHDLGKLSIPEGILAKDGNLSEDEFESMKSHAIVGFEMLNTSNRDLFRTAARIALEHHENWDGTGYPRGLKGEEIGLYSRIVTVADVFDALGNRRSYKKPWEGPDIMEFMYRETGKKFDPRVMDVFFERIDELNELRTLFPD